MLKGALYDSNNKKKTDIFLKIETAKVWPMASAEHIRFITVIIDHGNFMGVATPMTSQA